MVLILAACTARRTTPPVPVAPQPPQAEAPLPQPETPPKEWPSVPPAPEAPSPRAVASLELTGQGKSLLASGNPDAAISVLERAVSLNPANGRNYYYLSEAWLSKGNLSQAKEFNHLAEIYLQDEQAWLDRVAAQKVRIEKAGR